MSINVTVTDADNRIQLPEGLYKATVKEISEGNGVFGDYLKFTFEISEGDQKGNIIESLASKKLTKSSSGKNSKLFDYVKALTKSDPKSGESLDLESLVGSSCQILVRNGKEKDGVTYSEVSTVMPS